MIENNFVIGQCVRSRDLSAFIEVRAQSIDGVVRDISQTSRKEFPPHGEIEIKGGRAYLSIGDWTIARPMLEGPPRRKHFVSTWTNVRLLPLEELAEAKTSEAARRILVETGLQNSQLGERAFRIGQDEVVVVAIARSRDGRYRSSSPNLAKLPVFRFNADRVIRIPRQDGEICLLELDYNSQLRVINWSNDADYIAQVIRDALVDGTELGRALGAAAELLLAKADRLSASLSDCKAQDADVAHEILRSRNLAELLIGNRALCQEYIAALRSAPEIIERINDAVGTAVADEMAKARVEQMSAMTQALDLEIDRLRSEKEKDLKQAIDDLEASEIRKLQETLRKKEAETLSDLEAKRLKLGHEISSLERMRAPLVTELDQWQGQIKEAEERLSALKADVADRRSEVDRLIQMHRIISRGTDETARNDAPAFTLEVASASAKPIGIAEIPGWIRDCPLITEAGKDGLSRLTALLLAGGLPVLVGNDSDDVISVLSKVLSGGTTTSFECDPTVITVDDLWCRPGTSNKTPLGLALSAVRADGQARVCVIRKPELSPSRFWVSSLRSAARDGLLPRGILVCLSVVDERSPDAEDLINGNYVFRTDGWIAEGAALNSFMLVGDDSIERSIDLTNLSPDQTEALAAASGTGALRMRLAEAGWLTRLAPIAKVLLRENAKAFLKEIFTAKPEVTKSGLKVVDKRSG